MLMKPHLVTIVVKFIVTPERYHCTKADGVRKENLSSGVKPYLKQHNDQVT